MSSLVTLYTRQPSLVVVCALGLCIGGCANAGRAIGEEKLNGVVGRSVQGTYLQSNPNVEKVTGADSTRYIQKSTYGCVIEFVVENKSMNVTSWQYLSSPDLCWGSSGSY